MDRRALLQWYRASKRPLPWREEPDCYRVWLSEIMAQQTRIETMLPYFERFLARWPTVDELAAAHLDEVLKEWAGLGYYSRARKLHQSAILIAEHGFPDSVDGWKALPGIGDYTSAAIASIALGLDAAAVDGNVERVVCRRQGYGVDPRTAVGKREVRRVASAWLAPGDAGDWNQAVMELGATVCTPRRPKCGECPVAEGCVALAHGTVLSLPNKPRKQKAPEVRAVALCLRRRGQLFLTQRPETGLLAGLWEMPQSDLSEGETPTSAVGRLALEHGLAVRGAVSLGTIRHICSHRKLTLEVFELQSTADPGLGGYVASGWGREQRAISTCAEKAIALTRQTALLAAEGAP